VLGNIPEPEPGGQQAALMPSGIRYQVSLMVRGQPYITVQGWPLTALAGRQQQRTEPVI
jgi:hypothetical protein